MNDIHLTKIAVNQPFPDADFRQMPGIQILTPAPSYFHVVTMPNVTAQERHAYQAKSKLRLGLAEYDGLMFWLFKAGNMPWADVAVAVSEELDSRLTQIQTDDPQTRYLLNMVLVDSATNLVASLRVTTVTRSFALTCAQMVERQRQYAYDPVERAMKSIRAYHRFAKSEDLLKYAKVVEVAGQ